MRLLVFFDLPMETSCERKEYRHFRKSLIKEGYIMQQLSVYSKLEMNDFEYYSDIKELQKIKPKKGTIQALRITENQFSSICYILGNNNGNKHIDSTEGLVVI